MINQILSIIKEQARQHKSIKSFYYSRNHELGSGNESHPVFWLEDPIVGRNHSNMFVNSVNFSVLFVPKNEVEVSKLQNLAFSIGLNILERIKQDKDSPINIQPSWTYMTLRNYYDNNACGCRFSVNFAQLNMQDLCLIEEQFDENKEIPKPSTINNFDTSETFTDKLPVFDLKTARK